MHNAPPPTPENVISARRWPSVRTTSLIVALLALAGAACSGETTHQGPKPGAGASTTPPASTAPAASPPLPAVASSTPARATATRTRAVPPRVSATATVSNPPLPADHSLQSPLVVHSASGRILASEADGRGGSVRLLTYAASDGRRVGTQPLFPNEILLDVDDAGRAYVLGPDWGLRVLVADGAAEEAVLALPTPDRTEPAFQGYGPNTSDGVPFPLRPALPIVDRGRGHVLAFSGPVVTVVDAASRAVLRAMEVPPAGTRGSVVRAALDDAGNTLYLALADPELGDWEGAPGVRLLALDYRSFRVIEQREMRATLERWLPTGDGVVATGWSYKVLGTDQRVWKKGREGARRMESAIEWSAYDAGRDRLIGTGLHHCCVVTGSGRAMVVADAGTLDLRFLAAPAANQPTAYDSVTDQFYARSDDASRLSVVDAATLRQPTPEPPRAVWAEPYVTDVVASEGGLGPPPAIVGQYRPTAAPGQPPPSEYAREVAVSRDAGVSWLAAGTLLPGPVSGEAYSAWPGCVAASAEREPTLFGCVPGYGVFRSDDVGRSWQPASGGLEALFVRGLALSPNFGQDGTVFAEAEISYPSAETGWYGEGASAEPRASAWRSRDGGESWQPIGAYSAIAPSPDFARDRHVMAFEYQGARFHISHDAGTTWQSRGRLPELEGAAFSASRLWVIPRGDDSPEVLLALATSSSMMGGAQHWPESGASLFRSIDDGRTWDLAWRSDDGVGLDGVLLGPYREGTGTDAEGLPGTPQVVRREARADTWLFSFGLRSSSGGTLLSLNGGLRWQQVHLPSTPRAQILGLGPSGDVLVGGYGETMHTVRIEDFRAGPTPTTQP